MHDNRVLSLECASLLALSPDELARPGCGSKLPPKKKQ
jgi:hypothetical protein